MATRASPARNSCQPATDARFDAERPQQVEQQLAAAGRFRRQQHAARMRGEPRGEAADRLLAARVEARRPGPRVVPQSHRLDAGPPASPAAAPPSSSWPARAGGRRSTPPAAGTSRPGRAPDARCRSGAPRSAPRCRARRAAARASCSAGSATTAPVGQVVEQARGRLEEQRQVVLDAGRREALADVAVQRHARQVALEARAEAAAEVADRVRREAELARRQQLEALEPLARALRVGVEAADAVDLPVEQVDAQRRLAAHREHVEQRAADRELAGRRHLRHARVAGRGQAQPERLEVERLRRRRA